MMNDTGTTSGSADTAPAALSVGGPQPAWMTLNEARERAFTGEIVFEVDPEVLAYLDNGVVYYAECRTDASLGRRLVDAGVIEASQLERGTVRVGDVEHLGRLFDRDASVDRDAVLVVTETATENLVAELANRAVTTVRATAYRHHPSGVHRWFVTQFDPHAAVSHPVVPAAHIDAPVIEELTSRGVVADEDLMIEWDEIDDFTVASELVAAPDQVESIAIDFGGPSEPDAGESPELSFDMASFVDAPDAASFVDAPDGEFEFEVAWPDGTADAIVDDLAPSQPPVLFTQTDAGEIHFEMPELEVSDDVDADHVPDDVADAVRRAIAAIESATIETPEFAPVEAELSLEDHVVVDTFDGEFAPLAEMAPPAEAIAPPVAPVASAGAFAPPTMEMRAEVMYARADPEPADAPATDVASPSLPTPGVASVVFVDDEPTGGSGTERSSALRRLIGSLRRKDH